MKVTPGKIRPQKSPSKDMWTYHRLQLFCWKRQCVKTCVLTAKTQGVGRGVNRKLIQSHVWPLNRETDRERARDTGREEKGGWIKKKNKFHFLFSPLFPRLSTLWLFWKSPTGNTRKPLLHLVIESCELVQELGHHHLSVKIFKWVRAHPPTSWNSLRRS